MTIFLDTGIFFGAFNVEDVNHSSAQKIYLSVFDGNYGAVFTSDYIIDETITLLKVKASPEVALKFLNSALESAMSIIVVDEKIFKESTRVFERYYSKRGISFTDATTVAVLQLLEIDWLASFDARSFEGVVDRRLGE